MSKQHPTRASRTTHAENMHPNIAPDPEIDNTTPALANISWKLANTSLNDGDHVSWLLLRLFSELSISEQLRLMMHLAQDITRQETLLTRNDFNVMVEWLYRRKYLRRDPGLVELLSQVKFTEEMPLTDLQELVESVTVLIDHSRSNGKKKPLK